MKKINSTIIVCMNEKHAIGKNNDLLYHISNDLKRFKELTTNNIVIMGRKTFESLPKGVLPNRINIILTSNRDYNIEPHENAYIVHDIDMCCELINSLFPEKQVFVIGGSSIYKEFIEKNLVSKVELTYVHDNIEGDTYFPLVFNETWKNVTTNKEMLHDEQTNINYEFVTYEKNN